MWQNPQEAVDLVTFTEEILNERLHFLCSDGFSKCNDLDLIIKGFEVKVLVLQLWNVFAIT